MLHSRSAGLVLVTAWLIAGVANAGQGATSQLKKAASVESIVLLEAADQPKDFSPGVGHGILGRELFRQALLLAAREELGLTTRDASLGELAPDGLPQNNRFHLSFRVQVAKSAEFTLERRLKADVEQLLTKQWALEDKFITRATRP